jgi:hypothetical protein
MKMNHKFFALMLVLPFASICQTDVKRNANPTPSDIVVEQKRLQLLNDPDFQKYLNFEALQTQRVESDYYNDSKLNLEVIQSRIAEKTRLTSEEKIAIYEANGMINAKEYVEQVDIGFQSLRQVFKKHPELKQNHLFEKVMEKIQLDKKSKSRTK